MFVTSDMCLCDLVASKLMSIILIRDSNIENRKRVATIAYPAALELFPLVKTYIVFVDVVILFTAVQKSSHADHHHQRPTVQKQQEEVAAVKNKIKQLRGRCSQKTSLLVFTIADELKTDADFRPALLILVRAGNRMGMEESNTTVKWWLLLLCVIRSRTGGERRLMQLSRDTNRQALYPTYCLLCHLTFVCHLFTFSFLNYFSTMIDTNQLSISSCSRKASHY